MITDPALCRRALREIGEIAAVAVLENSQMTELEALESIEAIASWVRTEPGAGGRACRATIVEIHQLTAGADIDRLGDAEIHAQFQRVMRAIQRQDGEPSGSAA